MFDYNVLDDQEKITFALRSLYLEHGFTRYRMSRFEEYDFYSRNKDFLVSEGMITFNDTNGKLLALKPDVTLAIIKNRRDNPDTLDKLCYNENVYRVSKKTNSFTEIMQTGLECIGDVNLDCIRQVLSLAARSLAVCSPRFVLEVSHLGILSALVDEISLEEEVRRAVLKYVGEKNLHGIRALCRANGIGEERAAPLCRLLGAYGSGAAVFPVLEELCAARGITDRLWELRDALSVFDGTDLADRVQLDFSAVSDMNYYNGIIFQGFIDGIPERVLSGGQYDRLMRRLRRESRAVGFAVYLDRIERLNAPETEEDALC